MCRRVSKDKAITALCVQRSLVWTSFFSGRGRNATLVSTLRSTIEIQRSTSCFRCIDLKFSPASSQAWDNSFHCRAFHFTLPWRFLLCTIFTLITLHCKGQRDHLDVFFLLGCNTLCSVEVTGMGQVVHRDRQSVPPRCHCTYKAASLYAWRGPNVNTCILSLSSS